MHSRIAMRRAAVLLASAALSPSAHGRPSEGDGRADHHAKAHASAETPQDIVIVGHPPSDFALLSGTVSLEGDSLVAATRGQIGEMLARLPGVSATSFAPGASRPVLRGLDGDRVRVMIDGIGSIDASTVSADHAVVFDPLTTDHIDVVRGPAALLFGGQAIGGAVNAIDKRIPRAVPASPQATFIAGHGSASRERFAGAAADIALADRLAVHFDANTRKSGDLRVGGRVLSPDLRAELLEDAHHHAEAGETEEAAGLETLAGLAGRVANSAARTTTLGAGIAFIDARGNLGFSIQHVDSRYGVPERPGGGHGAHHDYEDHDHGDDQHDHGPVAVDLRQTRIDLRGGLEFGGPIESLQLRAAYGDYRHVELEDGEAGTVFASQGYEARADLVQARRGGWRGRSGVQAQWRKLTVRGPEAITPDYETSRFGVFTLQSVELGPGVDAEGALRYERAAVTARQAGFRRAFDLWSGALGLSWRPSPGWKMGINAIRGARAPAAEELLSDGLHVATQAVEVGDRAFRSERSEGVEAHVRHDGRGAMFSLTGYSTHFKGFIVALPTDAREHGFPVFQYVQTPARFRGFEAEARADVVKWTGGVLRLEGSADYTHARLKGIGPVPRIPALRLRGGTGAELGAFHIHGEVEWNDAQKRVAAFENPVKAYTLVNLSADWHPLGNSGPLTLLFAADNLFNAAGRRAASFTRDFVPVAGRDLRVTARITF